MRMSKKNGNSKDTIVFFTDLGTDVSEKRQSKDIAASAETAPVKSKKRFQRKKRSNTNLKNEETR